MEMTQCAQCVGFPVGYFPNPLSVPGKKRQNKGVGGKLILA